MEKRPLLSEQPSGSIRTLGELVGLANAIEVEAVDRYTFLAQAMAARGENDTAATFRQMCDIEKQHVNRVEHWAAGLGQAVPPPQPFLWLLPHEIADSWDEAQNSTLLTPYRALAIAVANEERAFALYAYIAAQASGSEVARQAEMMAREELAHAAELRVHRRAAFHREHPAGERTTIAPVESLAEFAALQQRLEAETASHHLAIAERLHRVGDTASADLVTDIARREQSMLGMESPMRMLSTEHLGDSAPSAALLRSALKPLERMSEVYEDLIVHAPGEEMAAAEQAALSWAVERIALIGARFEEIARAS